MGTALIYDEEMTKYKLLWVDPACKIEVPERLTVSYEALVSSGLAGRCVAIPPREAQDAQILLVHSKEYLEAVKKTPYMTLEDLQEFTQQYGDVYFHPNIYHCAKLAAGAALQLVDSIMTGKVRNGMALVRPPGHHSMRGAASGFCIFNNVAIAAKYAQLAYGVQRVLIVDWDIHHGQGVQYCFEDDPSVLYFSWHRYEHQSFWPNLRESDYDSVGKGGGAGFNINVPWNKVGMKNSDYLAVFFHVLLPVAYEFRPDLVLVCAGFDSAVGDPEGEMCATPDVFAHLTHLLANLAGGKLCAVLEGGYNLTSLAQSVCHTVGALLGDPPPRLASLDGPCQSALESIQSVRSVLQKYWSCLGSEADPSSGVSTEHTEQTSEGPGETADAGGEPGHKRDQVAASCVPPLVQAVFVNGCEPFDPSEKLRREHLAGGDSAPQSVVDLVVQMEQKEFRSALAVVSDVSTATKCIVQHVASTPGKRVLVVFLGDGEVLSDTVDNGEMLLVHISRREPAEPRSKYHVPVVLQKGLDDPSVFWRLVSGLLLPLGYQFNPSLVLLARAPDGGASEAAWQQLVGTLRGLAFGNTLALIQENDRACAAMTTSSLRGEAAPALQRLATPAQEDVVALESLRTRIQADWRLLRTSGDVVNVQRADESSLL